MSVRELLVDWAFLRVGIVGVCLFAFVAGACIGFVVAALAARGE